MRIELTAGLSIGMIGAQRLQCGMRQHAAFHALPCTFDQLKYAGNRLIDGTRRDQPEQPGNFNRRVGLACRHIRNTE